MEVSAFLTGVSFGSCVSSSGASLVQHYDGSVVARGSASAPVPPSVLPGVAVSPRGAVRDEGRGVVAMFVVLWRGGEGLTGNVIVVFSTLVAGSPLWEMLDWRGSEELRW